jgi:hypothetical protein
MFTLSSKDVSLLAAVAEMRITSSLHLAFLTDRNREGMVKRLGELRVKGWVDMKPRQLTRSRGRPEFLFSPTDQGIELLVKRGLLPCPGPGQPTAAATAPSSPDHCLLLNWVLVQVRCLPRKAPCLKTSCLSSEMAPAPHQDGSLVSLREQVHMPPSGKLEGFEPDLVFCIHHTELAKSLLFFVEVDMGTEERTSARAGDNSILAKVRRYQAYFEQNGYKRYEAIWKAKFRGFRLLVIANTSRRLVEVCRLIADDQVGPSGFIWSTDSSSLLDKGIQEKIWVRGGRDDRERESILGSQWGWIHAELAGHPPGTRHAD